MDLRRFGLLPYQLFVLFSFVFICACGQIETILNHKGQSIDVFAKADRPKPLPLTGSQSREVGLVPVEGASLEICDGGGSVVYHACDRLRRVVSAYNSQYLQEVDFQVDRDCVQGNASAAKQNFEMDFTYSRNNQTLSFGVRGELQCDSQKGEQSKINLIRRFQGGEEHWDPASVKRIVHRYLSHLEPTLKRYMEK